MVIRLDDCGGWYINEEVVIEGNKLTGYYIQECWSENETHLFESNDFEECLKWCWENLD